MEEHLLISQLKEGDSRAFKYIVDQWQGLVYNTALGLAQNAEDAEDIAQEVFVQVYQSIHSFKGDSKLSTWMYKITVTKSIDLLRKKKRKKRFGIIKSIFGQQEPVEDNFTEFHHPGVAYDQKENVAILFNAISRLPENQNLAYTLHKIEGLSYQEVSEIMGNSISAVESLIHRAKVSLKNILKNVIN